MRLTAGALDFVEAEQAHVGGFSIWIRKDPRARHWDIDVTQPILEGYEYELEPLVRSRHELCCVVDIGAHIGSFTMKVKRHWPRAHIIAAEPDPDSAALFRKNLQNVDGISLHEAAILGRTDSSKAHLRQTGRANEDGNPAASWVAEAGRGVYRRPRRPTLAVSCLSILDLLRVHGNPHIDLLKLDCEGAEGEILRTLRESGYLKRVGWIRGEWHFRANIPQIEAALGGTHRFHIDRPGTRMGTFIAHRNLEE